MPRGYSEVKTVEQCDASALLNLINSCDCFLSVDVEYVREVNICMCAGFQSARFTGASVDVLCVG